MVGFQPTTNVFQPGLHTCMGESSKGHASDPLEGCSLHAVYFTYICSLSPKSLLLQKNLANPGLCHSDIEITSTFEELKC